MKESYKRRRDFILTNSILWDSSWPRLLDEGEEEELTGYLESRFGIPPRVFWDYLWFKREKTWWMVQVSPFLEKAAALKISAVGLRAFTQVGQFIKPTTRMVQVFGKNATKSCLDLRKEDIRRLLAGDTLPSQNDEEEGYLMLRHAGDVIGLGLLLHKRVRSQLPRLYGRLLDPFLHSAT